MSDRRTGDHLTRSFLLPPGSEVTAQPGTLTEVCLLMFAWQTDPKYPLVVAANRDERFDRPAHSLCVLRGCNPRILGGRDDLAGGTWLAVNEHGVVVGLTNRPSPGGRDTTKRSRGELPVMAASRRTAEEGVAELTRSIRPGQYNPAWLLIGDRRSLYYVELTVDQPAISRQLSGGVHILENVALGQPSPKVNQVRRRLSASESEGASLWAALPSVLADHSVPASGDGDQGVAEDEVVRPPATLASCVHTDDYGTRSAALVRIPSNPLARPDLLVADGPPCTAAFLDVTHRWAP